MHRTTTRDLAPPFASTAPRKTMAFQAALLCLCLCLTPPGTGSAVAPPETGLNQQTEVYVVAKSGEELPKEEALAQVRAGTFKMTQIQDGPVLQTLLYQHAEELSGHMPPHLVAVMARMDAGVEPGSQWLGLEPPPFSLTDLQGEKVSSGDLAGKVVVLNYWFIGCAPCIREMPALTRLERRYRERQDVVFLALSFDAPEAIRDFLAQREFTYRQLPAPRDWFHEAKITAYPTHLVVDREGVIRGALEGLDTPEELEAELDRLIREVL